MASKMKNIAGLFGDSRTRIILIITICIIAFGIMLAIGKLRNKIPGPESNVNLQRAPTALKSIPFNVNQTQEYERLQQKQNTLQAEQAEKTGSSAIPTILSAKTIGQDQMQASNIQNSRNWQSGLGFQGLAQAEDAHNKAKEFDANNLLASAGLYGLGGSYRGNMVMLGQAGVWGALGASGAGNGLGMNGQGINGVGANGLGINGLAANGVGMNSMGANGVNGIGANGVSINGQGINGVGPNGLGMNGQGINGVGPNSLGMNGQGINGVGPNSLGMNGQGINGVGPNGLGMNGQGINGVGANGLGMNGQGINGVGANGLGMNGQGINGVGANGLGMNGAGTNGLGPNNPNALSGLGARGNRVGTSNDANAAALRAAQQRQLDQINAQKMEQMTTQMQSAMSTQAGLLFTAWASPSQVYIAGQKDSADAAAQANSNNRNGGSNTTLGSASQPLIKAGTIMFAVLVTAVNSDEPGPVMAKIVDGPYKDGVLIGQLTPQGEKVMLSFNLLNAPSLAKTVPVNAVAIDENTARTGLSSYTNNHYLLRYGSLFASSFMQGYGQAVTNAGSTISSSPTTGTQQSFPNLSPKGQIISALGNVGTKFGAVATNTFNIPPTVYVNSGTGVGILFVQDVTM